MYKLERHRRERNLVAIARDAIDNRRIDGYVLAFSRQLVVLQYVYDFTLDGLMVLRTRDITNVRCSDAEVFHKSLLTAEGVEDRVPFDAKFEVRNWMSLLPQLAQEYGLMILECEARSKPTFLIGRLMLATKTEAQILDFSVIGRWDDEPTTVPFADLTCCQVANNYLNAYTRHFARISR